VLSFEEGTPKYKYTGTTDWTGGPWSRDAQADLPYGEVIQPTSNTNPLFDIHSANTCLADVEGRRKFGDKFTWARGSQSVREYPDRPRSRRPRRSTPRAPVPFTNYSPFRFTAASSTRA